MGVLPGDWKQVTIGWKVTGCRVVCDLHKAMSDRHYRVGVMESRLACTVIVPWISRRRWCSLLRTEQFGVDVHRYMGTN